MPLTTRIFNWHDKEFRHADEVYIAVVGVLTVVMILGAIVLSF